MTGSAVILGSATDIGPHEMFFGNPNRVCQLNLRPLGKPAERAERAGNEEERRDAGADNVVEVLKRVGEASHRDPEVGPAEARDEGDADSKLDRDAGPPVT